MNTMAILKPEDFTARDIKQAILNEPRYLERADAEYFSYLDEFGIKDAEALRPVHNITKEALIQYASMLVVKDLMGYSYRQVADGVEEDPNKVKYDVYKSDYKDARAKLSYNILAKKRQSMGTASGRIMRT